LRDIQFPSHAHPFPPLYGCAAAFSLVTLFFIVPAVSFAQAGGTPFDPGFTAIQTLFTGTIAKVASLVAIVIGGYAFAHGEPGAKNFDHGYAVTSHSAQGLTADRVLVNADTSTRPDLINSRFAYVSVSRASYEATLFTDDTTKLSSQLSTDVSKTSALEINQTPPVAQEVGIGMGI
jgi:type IV secretory pathway VirB2 component (pilin)